MNTGAKPTRRCHWVPQAYLKGFAADNRKSPRIWRLSNQAGEPELKRIDKVAVRNHLYTVTENDGRRNDAQEKRFADLEQLFASRAWDRLRTAFVDLSDTSIRKMVALLAATLYVRSPANFDQYKHIHARFVSEFSGPRGLPNAVIMDGKRLELDHSDWEDHANADENELKRNWFEILNSCGDIAQMFLDMRWAIIAADTPVFVTSDHPITFLHPDLRFRGISNPETSVVFPLSPTRVLCMDNRHSEPDNQYYEAQHNGAAVNMLIWQNALEHMFSHRDPHSVCAEILALEETSEFQDVTKETYTDKSL
ncbi:DUF4238 domain-containing protein [Ruegeria sp. EL01]|jgi:hypothetical protein|uniref:DUF4238 domain-containing protein n=1 Tax=Ruegeria sp. EL01 TaxID=2107578 RepID=UPI000EA8161B|nr:DUF4238 domain-containing protein [Ruegeria sp. EL01]